MKNAKKIEATVKALGLEEKKVFTISELESIALGAKCSLHDAMWYLRYERGNK